MYWPVQEESDIDRVDDDLGIESELPPPSLWLYIKAVLVLGVGSGILGATIGAALEAFHRAWLAAMIGGIPLAVIGALMLGWYGIAAGVVNRLRYGAFLGVVLGSLGGGLIGVVAGLTIVALPWSLAGSLAGMFLGPYVLPRKVRRLVSFRGAFLGTCGGVLISALKQDHDRATAGAVSGAIAGLGVAAGLVLLFIGAVYLIPRAPRGSDEEADEFEAVLDGLVRQPPGSVPEDVG